MSHDKKKTSEDTETWAQYGNDSPETSPGSRAPHSPGSGPV